MKKYHISIFLSYLIIFLMGALLLIVPSFGINDSNYLFFILMLIYGFINYALYMITRRKDDYEYLFISLVSIIAGAAAIVLYNEKPEMVLSLSLMGFISMVAIIKLIKIDYYHDRNNILWFVRTISFVLFLIVGTLTSVNLFYNIKVQSLMLGFFLMSASILEMFDPIVDFIVVSKIRSVSKNVKPVIIQEEKVLLKEDENVEVKKEEKKVVKKSTNTKAKPKTTKTAGSTKKVASTPKKPTSSQKKTSATKTKTAGSKKTTGKTSKTKSTTTKKSSDVKK